MCAAQSLLIKQRLCRESINIITLPFQIHIIHISSTICYNLNTYPVVWLLSYLSLVRIGSLWAVDSVVKWAIYKCSAHCTVTFVPVHNTKARSKSRCIAHSLTSSLDGGKWSASHPSPLVWGEGILVAIEWEALTTVAVTFVCKEKDVIRMYGNLGSMKCGDL
jgi:hypothetical protein